MDTIIDQQENLNLPRRGNVTLLHFHQGMVLLVGEDAVGEAAVTASVGEAVVVASVGEAVGEAVVVASVGEAVGEAKMEKPKSRI